MDLLPLKLCDKEGCLQNPTGGGGGGGGTFIIQYAYWVCAARETPIFQPWIGGGVTEHIIFTNVPKNPFRSITILHFLADFANIRRPLLRANKAFEKRRMVSSIFTLAPARCILAVPWRLAFSRSKRIQALRIWSPAFFQARSGALHYSRSIGSLFRSPCPCFHFAAAHTYQNLEVSTAPPRTKPNMRRGQVGNLHGLARRLK